MIRGGNDWIRLESEYNSLALPPTKYKRATAELELGSVLKLGWLNPVGVIGKAVNGVEGSTLL